MGMCLGRCLISTVNPIIFTLFKADFRETVTQDKMKLLQMFHVSRKNFKKTFNNTRWRIRGRHTNEYY